MTERGRSDSLDRLAGGAMLLAALIDLWIYFSLSRKDRRWLKRATEREGKRLAEAVRRGEVTRAQVEAALKEYGDAEPAIALRWLDRWGIKQ